MHAQGIGGTFKKGVQQVYSCCEHMQAVYGPMCFISGKGCLVLLTFLIVPMPKGHDGGLSP